MRPTRTVLLIVASLLSIPGARAGPSGPINVLVMHWYGREDSLNDDFDRTLQAAMNSSSPGGVEYYSEYLETNKFPGEDQARLLSEYLRQKYASKRLDVIVSGVSETLDFLLEYRNQLFPGVPIVFATERPVRGDVVAEAGATGFTFGNTYAKTLNLALKWHPGTKQLFVVSGTLGHDKAVESIVRHDLRQYESRVTITYLTDLAPYELAARIRTLPKDSLIFYIWQQVLDARGRLLEARDVLARVVNEAKVPIYGRSHAMIGRGIVGGYVWTQEGNATKLADITLRVVNGTRPKDIPVEIGPDIPMFDWRELQRWGIGQDRLPPGSIIRFRDITFWRQYRGRVAGALAIVVLQAVLIGALLVQRKQAKRRAAALIEAQRVVQESEERFRRVFEEGPLGLALVGKDYRFVKVNGALCQMLGYDKAALVQMSFVDVTHRDDVGADLELAEQLFKREIPFYRIQKRYVKKTGEIIWINLTASVILAPNGEPLHGLAMVEDITERKRAQEESFARQKLESLGTLASGIAHDFNNLLGGVMAQAELALEDYQAGSSPVEELKRIRDGAIRGSEIVRQLMIYAGKESGAVGLVDVSQVARGMVELLKVSISKHAALVTDFGDDLPAVRGSTGELQQIVMNLVTNASEALEERDGVIRVATRHVNLDRAEAISKGIAEGDYVELEVTDTGRGMSLETQARVFDPFFTTKSQGHGLGMGVVRGIVRGLGGAIHLSTELGKGSTFQIFLRSTGIMTGASVPIPSAGESRAPQPATILVVEDDDALRVALAQILRRRGFETLDATNGVDAINLLRATSIKLDMMLLDMTIPGPSSREVAARAAEARPGLKVVLTSAYDEELVKATVGATQACGFVRKPFQIDELVHTLRSALSLRSTTS